MLHRLPDSCSIFDSSQHSAPACLHLPPISSTLCGTLSRDTSSTQAVVYCVFGVWEPLMTCVHGKLCDLRLTELIKTRGKCQIKSNLLNNKGLKATYMLL